MLELYHHGSSVCAAKVRLAMAEKGVVADRYHYVDILEGEQFSDEYRKINPNSVVPSMIHDGRIINESTLICEYVDAAFAGPPLRPDDPYGRYLVATWTKAVDELLHPACAEVTYVSAHRHIIRRLPPDELEAYFQKTPERSVKGNWRDRKRALVMEGFDAPGVDSFFRLYDSYLAKMETALEHGPWLAGAEFTLADIALAPYLLRLDMLNMRGFWEGGRLPRVAEWYGRFRQRPTFGPALVEWCPEALANDLGRYGAESWPDVRRIVGIR
jgi:ganglioside-induced differentiation-associated protein 1